MKRLLTFCLCLLGLSVFGQGGAILRNYFTTNADPSVSITNGNLISTNIYVSNVFATNITVNNITNLNEFHGRTEFVTNLFVTNSLIQYLTNNYFYTTNVTEQFVTNQLSYITNLYGPFITNNTLYSTNIYVTNLTANYITNNTSYITNLYSSNIFTTNLYATNIYTTNLYSSNIFTTNLYATNIYTTNLYSSNIFTTNLYATNIYTTNLYSSNIFTTNLFTTNLFATYITNDTFYTTNLFVSNVFATNITVDVITNNLFVSSNIFTTNLFVSNIFTTNITLMEAIWNTNKWNGPTNDVSFKATYQKYVTSTDMEITGLIDSSASNANTSVLLIDPGGATRTLYFPAVFTNYTSDGNNAYTIPSTNIALVTLFQYGNQNTNVVVRLFGPGTGTPAPVAQVWTNDVTTDGTFDLIRAVNNRTNYPGFVTNGLVFTGSAFWANEYWDNVNPGFSALSQAGFMGDDPHGNLTISLESINNSNFDADNQIQLNSSTNSIESRLTLSDGRNPKQNFFIFMGEIYDGRKVGDYLWNNIDQWWWSTNGIITANGFTDASFAANGVVTNDSTGLLHTTPTLPSTLLPTDLAYTDKNNAFTTASSNYVAMTVTTSTNQNQVTPDFSVPEQLMSTNSAFTFLAPVGVDTTKTTVQWTLVNVTNTTAAAVLITSPANCHTVGTAYVTNLTAVWFQCYAQKFTNAFYIPVF